ncbi:SEC-C metal-binding domain-containing protein [Neobacillus drentensis]|uniref:SEC-C metal-binding domain-containing protein n=1 Tax=Neobacillus drentensis TaxID=220684 RepID=UPI002FFE3D43
MNTSSIDKETYEKLQGALEDLKDMSWKNQQKRELKMWSEISVPLTIKDALTRYSKDELSDIRRRLEIKGASQLKKGELIDLLAIKIPFSLEKICMYLDQERFNLIKKLVHHSGYMEAPKLTANQLNYFFSIGIIYTGTFQGKKIIVIPEELVQHPFIRDNHKPLITISRRNTEWIKLTQGLLYYYGSLTLTELHELLEKYMNEPISLSDYLSVIDHAISYYEQIRMDKFGFSNVQVFDSEKVMREHKDRKDLAFFPFSKEQLLRAGEIDYIERNDHYRQFVHFLTQNFEMSRHAADEMVQECVYATNIGESPKHILQFLQSRLEFEKIEVLQACMDHVINLMNNTKQWFLKGYSPNELLPHEQKTIRKLSESKEKIGRNAPCPCGSNKKYKKCCGK